MYTKTVPSVYAIPRKAKSAQHTGLFGAFNNEIQGSDWYIIITYNKIKQS